MVGLAVLLLGCALLNRFGRPPFLLLDSPIETKVVPL